MPVKTVSHIPLAKCRVLYLGSAVPLDTAVGLEAVQQPLAERYPVDREGDVSGIDAWITVLSSGVHMQYLDDPSTIIWFPIQTLQVCTAVKCVVMVNGSTGEKTPKFVSLDNPASTSTHPPIFAAVMRRTKGIKVLECHSFICKSNTAAMALVQSCRHAFQHKEGWVDGPPPAEVLQGEIIDTPVGTLRGTVNDSVHLMPAESYQQDIASEFLNSPPPQGVFYTNNKKLVRNFNVFGREPGGPRGPPGVMRHPMISPPRMQYARYPPPFLPTHAPPPRMIMSPPMRGPPMIPLPPLPHMGPPPPHMGPPPQHMGPPPPHMGPPPGAMIPYPPHMMPPRGVMPEETMYFIPADAVPGRLPAGLPDEYFEDWGDHAGVPLAQFPDVDPEMVHTVVQEEPIDRRDLYERRSYTDRRASSIERGRQHPAERRHSSSERHNHQERRRSSSRERYVHRRVESPDRRPRHGRHQSPSPERRHPRRYGGNDADPSYNEESSSSGDLPRQRYRKHRDPRPRTPPADYVNRGRNGHSSPERVSRREQYERNRSLGPERRRFPSAYDRRDESDGFPNGVSHPSNHYEEMPHGDRNHRARSQPPMYAKENVPHKKSSKKKKVPTATLR